MRKLLLYAVGLLMGSTWGIAAPGACPSGSPVTGNHCYYIAANGTDTNTGADESHPWLRAPGMPNCSNTCAGVTSGTGNIGFIFRGGDTWHFGNSGASPYTGGTWDIYNWGIYGYSNLVSNCVYEGTQSGCWYFGVDKTWHTGATWARPILTADNPLLATPGYASYAASCAYQVATTTRGNNIMVSLGNFEILDNFEFTGMCTSDSSVTSGNQDAYVEVPGGSSDAFGMVFITNDYFHGWSGTATAGTGNSNWKGTIIGGGSNNLEAIDHIVVDGSDSDYGAYAWATFPSFYHFRDSIVRYTGQGVGQQCHDIHDNIFEYMYTHDPNAGSHSNVLECNHEANGSAPNQPSNTPNVFYNNIGRHYDPNLMSTGQVNWWFCPNTIPDFWFGNILYDTGGYNDGNLWAMAGAPTYSDCTATGGQFMFNNTISGGYQLCHGNGSNVTGGIYTTVFNEHLLNSPWDGSGCTGYLDSSDISMTWATGNSQGYMSGSAGISDSDTCANDTTKPCSPTSAGNGTVGTGANHNAYCATLATYSTEPAIGTDAANACKLATTDACSYNLTTHTMTCPAQTAVVRPPSSAWDAGAYQFSNGIMAAPAGFFLARND